MAARTASTRKTPDTAASVLAGAQQQADAIAKGQHEDLSIPVVPGINDATITPFKPSHRAQERPADSGFVYGSPAQVAERQGQYAGGERVFVVEPPRAPAPSIVMTDAGAGKVEPTPMVDARGLPDLPALERHNAEVAAVAAATVQNNPGTDLSAIVTRMVGEEGDKSLTTEGNLDVRPAAEGGEVKVADKEEVTG